MFQDRNFPNTLSEMRRVAEESQRFPQQEVPPRQHEKERVIRAFQEIERTLRDSGESLDRDLMPESLDRNWQQMMMLYQERHQIIQEEIARLVYPIVLYLNEVHLLILSCPKTFLNFHVHFFLI